METLVLQHIACEPPGVYEDALSGRGATIHRVELDEGDGLPDWYAWLRTHLPTSVDPTLLS